LTGDVVDHDMGNRISYYIYFFLLLLIFLIIFQYKFDQMLDVMLQTHSSPPSEARSPPPARRSDSHRSYTQHPCSYRHNPRIPLYLIFKGGAASDGTVGVSSVGVSY
jgi:hypothetical protein